MNRKPKAVIAAISLFVALASGGQAAVRIVLAEAEGRREARVDFDRLSAILGGLREAGGLGDPAIRDRLLAHYASSPRLLLASVHERGEGTRWRLPSASPYLPASSPPGSAPEPDYPERSALLIRAPLPGDSTGRLALEALYVTLSQAAVFVPVRDACLGLGAYLALLAALVLAAALGSAKSGSATWTVAADRTGGAVPPGEPESADAPGAMAAGYSPEYPPSLDEEFLIPDIESTDPDLTGPDLPEPLCPEEKPACEEAAAPAAEGPPRGLYSPRSGLGWGGYLRDRLGAELARSASFEQDLSLVCVEVDALAEDQAAYAAVAAAVGEFWSFRDLAFERGGEGFSVVLPNIDLEHALRMAEEFFRKLSGLLRAGRDPLDYLPVYMGIASRSGRLVDAVRLEQEAESALYKAREERDSHIVGFKPDPDKYRIYLASKGC